MYIRSGTIHAIYDLFVKQSVSFKNHYSFVPTTCVAKSDAIPVSYGYNCCGSLWYSFFNAPLATYSQDNLRATLFWNVYLQRVLIRSGSTNHDSSMNAFQVSYITEITGVKCCYFLVTYWFFFFFSHENLSIKNIIAVWWNIEVIV